MTASMMKHEEGSFAGESPAGDGQPSPGGPDWRHSLLGKVAVFLLLCVFLAYGAGAAVGFIMLEYGSREQWRRQAGLNAQIASAAIRSIYTAVSVETSPAGQVTRIISELPIGDETSILTTGFNPADVLALAAAQTRHPVWLFQPDAEKKGFVAMAASEGGGSGYPVIFWDNGAPTPAQTEFFVGIATIQGVEHMVSALPVTDPAGRPLGLVVSSVGETADLFQTRNQLVRQSLLVLMAVLALMAGLVIFLMSRLFRPVPALIEALTRISDNDTGVVTPFQGRADEIGRLAVAIETLREAVVEREHLREVREATLQFEYMAHHDVLTGLPNRALLNKVLEKAMLALPGGREVNFLMFDLDRFKPVNDTHGHAVGDALLTAVASRITLALGPEDMAARLGGDEFAIIQFVSQDGEREGRALAARLVEMLATPFVIDGLELTIGASVGIARAPLDGCTVHDMLTRADLALYAAKHRGRGTYERFHEDMMAADRRNLACGT